MKKSLYFIQKEPVFCVAMLLALISVCFTGITEKYLEYIDIDVLILLFALMAVVAGMRDKGVFTDISNHVLKYCKTLRGMAFLLSLVNFFMAMFITNDVVLITFVPLSLMMLKGVREQDKILVVVLETVSANLGSMLTPIGNPQNLYLFSYAGYGVGEFVLQMLPVTVVSLILICIIVVFMPQSPLQQADMSSPETESEEKSLKGKSKKLSLILYFILFAVCLLAVFHVLPHWVVLIVVVAALLIFDRKILLRVDYILLFTFVAFFIFIGNLGEIEVVRTALQIFISGREGYVGILASQVFSNVPAAMLLSTFSKDIDSLLWGVNIGGLGTLIASMASLISYKFYAAEHNCKIGRYMFIFTVVNVLLLVLLTVFMSVWFCFV